MKKLLVILLAAAGLGGCAQITTAYNAFEGINVSPTQILVEANSFDAVEATAKNYLNWCTANKALPAAASPCALATRQKVVATVRAGRAARAQLEPYITNGTAGPATIYNALIAAVTTLQSTTPAVGN